MTPILDAADNQPLVPDLAAEVAGLVADSDAIIAHYQAQGHDPSDNWDFEEALNALGAALYSNNVDEIGRLAASSASAATKSSTSTSTWTSPRPTAKGNRPSGPTTTSTSTLSGRSRYSHPRLDA